MDGIDDFNERLEREFDELGKKYKITWKNKTVRQKAINTISEAGKKREDYRKAFKKLVWEKISKEYAHFMAKKINEGKVGKPVGPEKVMNVSFDVIREKRKVHFEIKDIEILPHHADRRMLIPDVFK